MSRMLFSRVLLAGGLVGAAAAPVAAAAVVEGPSVREVRIASGSAARGTTVSDLQGGHGVLVWRESRTRGKRPAEFRIAALVDGKIGRSGWGRNPWPVGVARQVDERTGRVVVRLVAQCPNQMPVPQGCRPRLLSPTTLRETRTVFAGPVGLSPEAPGGPTITNTDGATQVVGSTVPGGQTEPGRDGDLLPASSCAFAVRGTAVAIPAIPDCASRSVTVSGEVVLASSSVPSRTASDSFFAQTRVDAFDLARPADGWRPVGQSGSGKAGSTGVQQACVLDQGVAVLDGQDVEYDDDDPATWSIAVDPLARAGARWSAPAPQLAPPSGGLSPRIACANRSVYALITTFDDKLEVAGTRVVRLKRPR